MCPPYVDFYAETNEPGREKETGKAPKDSVEGEESSVGVDADRCKLL